MESKHLGEFELILLMSALRLGPDDAYAVAIVDDIEQRTGRSVRRANVYTALQRLERKGLIATRLGEPRAERGGKARRHVEVTRSGIAAVRQAAAGLQAMLGGLDGILKATR